jgi:hypothetical protein
MRKLEIFLWNGGKGKPTVLCCRDRKLRGHAWKFSYVKEDKAGQLSSAVGTGNCEDGMEDKASQLSSVVGTGNCEDMRGNFPME